MTNATVTDRNISVADKADDKPVAIKRDIKAFVLRFCESSGKVSALAADVLDGKVFADWTNVTDDERETWNGGCYAYMHSRKATHQTTIAKNDSHGVRQYFMLARGMTAPDGAKVAYTFRPGEVMATSKAALAELKKTDPVRYARTIEYRKYCQSEASKYFKRLMAYVTDLNDERTRKAVVAEAIASGQPIPEAAAKGAGKGPTPFNDWLDKHMGQIVSRAVTAMGRGEAVSKEIVKHAVEAFWTDYRANSAKYAGSNKA